MVSSGYNMVITPINNTATVVAAQCWASQNYCIKERGAYRFSFLDDELTTTGEGRVTFLWEVASGRLPTH